jgi:hypothetical protein
VSGIPNPIQRGREGGGVLLKDESRLKTSGFFQLPDIELSGLKFYVIMEKGNEF